MKHLRLVKTHEYFKNNHEATFLGNIKDINIIVGANNTRKSRFLRTIIAQNFNVLLDGSEKFNDAFFDSSRIFDELSKLDANSMSERLFQFQILDSQGAGNRFQHIKDYFGNNSQVDFNGFQNSLTNINETLIALATTDNFTSMQTIAIRLFNTSDLLIELFDRIEKTGLPRDRQTSFTGTSVQGVNFLFTVSDHYDIKHFELKKNTLLRLRDYVELLMKMKFESFDRPLIYIPVLRTSRMIEGFTGDVYGETILKQNFSNPTGKLNIETGLLLYEKISLAKNGTRKQARDFSAFEKFLGNAFFQSDDVHIVAHQTTKKDEKHIKVSLPNEMEDISIHDLGDGIQALINLLFPVFTATDGSWIFIDEPENHMHPGYQNLFMDTITNNESIRRKKLRFFINTHSNHILSGALLAPTSAEILVFSRRDDSSSYITTFNGNEYSTLEKLGVFNTSVLISNCSIWIEGVTDRFYLQAYLHAYLNSENAPFFKPIEGLHYSFIEYGGKNLIHYEFDHSYNSEFDDKTKEKIEAFFINTNIFLLADSDFDSEKHKLLENIAVENFEYHKTDLPEIENLLPDTIIKRYLKDRLRASDEEIDLCFPITHKTKLGKQFSGKIKRGEGFRKIEAKHGGTLAPLYKKSIAEYVHEKLLDGTFSWADLEKSEQLKKIIKAMYDFIVKKNNLGGKKA